MSGHRFRTVVFDLDGTLTDPKVGITTSIQYALAKLGRPAPAADDLTWCIGPPLIKAFEKMVGAAEAERGLALYRERYAVTGLFENAVFAGIPETLAAVAGDGVRLLVATSKPHVYARRILEHFGLHAHFEAIDGSELDGRRTDKRDLLAWQLIERGIDPAQAVMIGDREHDAIGARHNGMTALGVLYGYGSREELTAAGAHALCGTPEEIPGALARL